MRKLVTIAPAILVTVVLFVAILRGRRGTSETLPDSIGDDTGRRWLTWGGSDH